MAEDKAGKREKFDSIQREPGDLGQGDQRRFLVVKNVKHTMAVIPQELKEQRAALVKQIEDIDAMLQAMDQADVAK